MPPTTNVQIIEKITTLIGTAEKLESSLNSLGTEVSNLRLVYEKEHVRLVEQVSSAHKRIDAIDNSIKSLDTKFDLLETSIQPLKFQSKLLGWVGGAFGMLVIALLWAIFTHAIQLIR